MLKFLLTFNFLIAKRETVLDDAEAVGSFINVQPKAFIAFNVSLVKSSYFN